MARIRPLVAAVAGLAAGAGFIYGLYRSRRRWLGRTLGLPPSAVFDVIVDRAVKIPLPDGITLDATHYYPAVPGDFPTLLIRTPYGLPHDGARLPGLINGFPAQRFAERGYHVIIQSTRGRYGSEGEFTPFVHEAADGRATLDWIAQQPWFNGAIGLYGASYVGYVQWAVAADAPPTVKAMLPMITGSNIVPIFMPDGALNLDTIARWMFIVIGAAYERQQTLQRWLYFNGPAADQQYIQPAFQRLPLGTLDETVAGQPVSWYRDWLQHLDQSDPVWRNIDHSRAVPAVTVPVHLIGGWYDIFLRELLADYAALKAAGRRPYLTIDGGAHADPRHVVVSLQEGLAWFDAHLKGDASRVRTQPVRLFILGADEWRDFADWPPPAEHTRFYLHALQQLLTTEPAIDSTPDQYTYDPNDPTPSHGGPLLSLPSGPTDNRVVEARADVITYTTPPFDHDVDVIGAVNLELYVHSDRAHTDFFGRVCDVYPDGKSVNICDGLLRVQPGTGEAQPDGSLKITIGLWATAARFKTGHRLRLQVASGAHPRWNRNPGTGEGPADALTLLPARQTIYHDRAHPSALILPLSAA